MLQSNLVSDIKNAKASWKGGNEALKNLRIQLEEVLEELHAKERQVLFLILPLTIYKLEAQLT